MTTMYKSGIYRGEKIEYSDGIGYCIWVPFYWDVGTEYEDCGSCIDFDDGDIDNMIENPSTYFNEDVVDAVSLLRELKHSIADKYEDSE